MADEYGLDVWIWYPAMDTDYGDPKTVEFALRRVGAKSIKKLPRIDAVFVPGGDPGHTQPKHLMALLEKQTGFCTSIIRRPRCGSLRRVSTRSGSTSFTDIMRTEPAWLTGVVFGPQVRVSLPELRETIPARYPIRHYPDITHSRQCQYPGARLGLGPRDDVGSRGNQSRTLGRGLDLSPAAARTRLVFSPTPRAATTT